MNYAEALIEQDLQELLSGAKPPDLIERTLARLDEPRLERETPPARRVFTLRRLAEAAVVIAAIAIIGWLIARPQSLPPEVTAASGAQYKIHADHVELNGGWLLVTEGAPEVRVGARRIGEVRGRAVVGPIVPEAATLAALADELKLTEKEKAMFSNAKCWFGGAGLALCLFTGSLRVDGELMVAQDATPDAEVVVIPDAEKADEVAKLLRKSTSIRVNYHNHMLTVSDAAEVSRITKALTGEGFKASDKDLSIRDPWDWLWFTLPDGRTALAVGLSQGSDTEKGYFDLEMPGWKERHAYAIPAEAIPTLKEVFDQAARQPKAEELPKPGEVDKLKELLGKATGAELRVLNDDYAWSSWLQVQPQELEGLRDLLRNHISKASDEPAGWENLNEFRLTLPDGRVIEAAVYSHGNRLRLKLPGWRLWQDYDTNKELLEKMWLWLARAKDGSFAKGFEVLRKWSGPDSRNRSKKAHVEIVSDQKVWEDLWLDVKMGGTLLGLLAYPVIDFQREMVVAVFAGETFNSRGFYVHETLQGENGYTVRVNQLSYQTMNFEDRVTPYGIFVLPKFDGPIVVEENVQNMIGQPPKWLETGARAEGTNDPPPVEYKPVKKHLEGKGGVNAGFLSATNQEQWKRLLKLIEVPAASRLEVDFEKHVVVAVASPVAAGSGYFKLDFVGRNSTNTAMRLTTPTAQSMGDLPQLEAVYGVWVLPKPAGKLTVETPEYGRLDQPLKWLEKYEIKP